LSREVLALAREAVGEAAKSRFKANFATEVCQHCRGLKAGPGVSATCFQMQACYFDNFREDETSPKQKRIIDSLLRVPNPLANTQKGT
jgi:hypothetical protein